MNTFLHIIFVEMAISVIFFFLKSLNMFVWIYADDELYPNWNILDTIFDPLIIVPAVSYTIGIFLFSLMMVQSIRAKTGRKWTKSKIRITSILCLKAFEWEILTFTSLFISIDYLDVVDVFGLLIYIIAVLIMSWDDTSSTFVQAIWLKKSDGFESEVSEVSVTEKHKILFENLIEFYVVETDQSIVVKHREAASKHYKEASIEYFGLKFYGINLNNVDINHSDEREIIRRRLNEFFD